MTRKLNLGGLSVPDDAVTQTFVVFGKRGSGKSNTAVVLAEEMHKAGAQIIVLDPIGAWWGLKSSFDGSSSGLPVYVFGGQHGDLPLSPTEGKLMAQVAIEHRIPMVLDLTGWSGNQRAGFVTAFARWMLEHNDRVPVHVFLEEADAFIPQRPYKGEEEMLGAMDRLIRWGRAAGIGATAITQRSAKINKDVTTQAEVLIAHRTIGPQDVAAIKEWIRYHASGDEQQQILSTLPTLPDGTAWVWSPDWLDLLRQVAFRRRSTFDSASTPKLGEKRVQPKALAPVDVDRLRDKLGETMDKAKAEDPKELSKTIAELKRQLSTRPTEPVEKIVEVEVVTVEPFPVIHQEELAAIAAAREAIERVESRLLALPKDYATQVTREQQRPSRSSPVGEFVAVPGPEGKARPRMTKAPVATYMGDEVPKLGKAALTILSALAAHREGVTQKQLAFWTGYKPNTSTLSVALGLLRREGLVEQGQPVKITDRGMTFVPEGVELPPERGPELAEYWSARLGKGPREVLRVMIAAHPQQLSNAEIAERAGYNQNTSTLSVALGRLRSLKLVDGFSVSEDLIG